MKSLYCIVIVCYFMCIFVIVIVVVAAAAAGGGIIIINLQFSLLQFYGAAAKTRDSHSSYFTLQMESIPVT